MDEREHLAPSDPELDAALHDALGELAGPPAPSAPALGALRPRLVRARRAQRIRVVGAAAVVLAGVVVTALAVGPTGDTPRVVVPAGNGSRPSSASSTTGSTAPSTTRPSTRAPSVSGGPTGTAPDAPASSASTGTLPAPGPAPTAAPPATNTYSAPGGSVTVRFENGALALTGYAANPGFVAEVHQAVADDVEVRFEREGDGGESRIRVRVEQGSLVVETE
jgi:hypothetical protein